MITSVIPKLPFIDKTKTVDFYRNVGFDLIADYGDYLILSSAKTELHFFSFPDLVPQRSDFMIYLRTDADIEIYYQKLQDLGIAIHPNGKLGKKPWNQTEF